MVTDTVTVIETAPAAVVIVDPEGNPVFTSYASATSAAVQAAAVPSSSAEENAVPTSYSFPSWKSSKKPHTPKTSAAPATTSTPPPATTAAPSPTTTNTPDTTTATSSPSGGYIAPSASASADLSGYGVAYSPYNSDGTCRAASDVTSDIAKLKGFAYVRSYGVDCEQVPNMMSAAKAVGMKVMLGVFDLNDLDNELNTLISGVNNDWDTVQAVSIGNEDVNQGKADVGTVVAATNTGRSKLRSAGFNGDVVHVDTFNQILDNPELCKNSDVAAANCHAFFDPNTAAADAGTFVKTQADKIAEVCGKPAWITESGWPHGGDTNGLAIPSPADQQTALSSLKSTFTDNFVFFSAYNDLWKQDNSGTYGAEHFWGMFDTGDDIKGF